MSETPVGKGRPTPKRSEKAPRRGGPVAPPPQTRKEAAKRQKEQATAARQRIKEGASRGDERYLAPRDAGPVRMLVRDTVDGRRNVGVLLLPLALVLIVVNISGNRALQNLALLVWAAAIVAVTLDLVLTALAIRKGVRAEHPDEQGMGRHLAYGLLRSTVIRRFRLPVPRVSPGK